MFARVPWIPTDDSPSVCPVNESLEDEILTEARRAITFQAASLDELRSRTGLLLAAASVSASFLGAASAKGGGNLGFCGGAALVAFVIAIGCCIWVLMPRRDGWTFITSPTTLKKDWIDTQRPTESMKLFLATSLETTTTRTKGRWPTFTSSSKSPPVPSPQRSYLGQSKSQLEYD